MKFAQFVADFTSATIALQELPNGHDRHVFFEAARMWLIEAYEGAHRGRRLRAV